MQDIVTRTNDSANLAVLRAGDHIRELVQRVGREEEGQTAAEYIGLIVLVVAILAAALSQAPDIGEAISTKIMEVISKIGGGG